MASLKQLRYLDRKYGSIHPSIAPESTNDHDFDGSCDVNSISNRKSEYNGRYLINTYKVAAYPAPKTIVDEFPEIKCEHHGRRNYVVPDSSVPKIKTRTNGLGNHCTK